MARVTDRDLLTSAKEEAQTLLGADPGLSATPELATSVGRYLARVVDEVG
jgi:hypothetical protein